jgi:chromosome condensin MukBEF MukE localization factor
MIQSVFTSPHCTIPDALLTWTKPAFRPGILESLLGSCRHVGAAAVRSVRTLTFFVKREAVFLSRYNSNVIRQ